MVIYIGVGVTIGAIRSLGFEVETTYSYSHSNMEHYAGFEIKGVYSYGCWRIDEQVAVNKMHEKLVEIYNDLLYWSNASK
ncbi:MAG: hypothetical protein [Caudoviricetes sp.]|nr:MAG: hypothetical protein [Caudoviricetes sp.]